MNINEEREWLEKIVNERGYNHDNLHYSIFSPGRNIYEVRIDLLDNNQYFVSCTNERAWFVDFERSQKTYDSFKEAAADFLDRLDAVVEYNRLAVKPDTIPTIDYHSPLWDEMEE
ncbi:hypothetical protein FFRU_040240 [Fructobacillus fructosus]|uniref:Imm59 family immunity protein n=1 Tax=Fructobacillus fructosus TaxID=1631 RepID=UPI0002194749|nr:Imm59 family immunity protein [Fructobacillus fructosus]KRN52771.1 hypothetical protein IV71_GL000931 [Fructobacillus fructosus KCTC 3544]GAP01090.1 hypothetical protein FFRU_040240 [Fructobacillus fructosus]